MKRLLLIPMLILLLTSGCASSAVRSLGRTTTFDGPRGAVLWTNQNIGVQDIRYQVTEPFRKETVLESRFYVVTPPDIAGLTNTTEAGHITVPYRNYPVNNDSLVAHEIDSVLSSARPGRTPQTPSVDRIWVMSKGFGGVYPLEYSVGDRNMKLRIGPQFSHEAGQDRTISGKVLQILLIPAAAFDFVTFPIQFLYFTHRLGEVWH